MGGGVVSEVDIESIEVCYMRFSVLGDEVFRGDALFFGSKHNRSAVGIIGAEEVTSGALQAPEAHPAIAL